MSGARNPLLYTYIRRPLLAAHNGISTFKKLPSIMWRQLGTGWRRTALINTLAVFTFTLFGIILLICTVSKSGGLGINYIVFQGTCAKSRSINTWLHLFLNAYSTAILASSNFFMQVLTSPTRSEVDKAHSDNISLKIGVQSMRNLYRTPIFSSPLFRFISSSTVPSFRLNT